MQEAVGDSEVQTAEGGTELRGGRSRFACPVTALSSREAGEPRARMYVTLLISDLFLAASLQAR